MIINIKNNIKLKMSEEKVKEIQDFVDSFNQKLRESFLLYEAKQKKLNLKKLKKSHSQVNKRRKTEDDKLPTLSSNKDEKYKIRKNPSDYNIFNKYPTWKPPRGAPDYFEEFKGLRNEKELDSWEKVCKYNNLLILFIGKNMLM